MKITRMHLKNFGNLHDQTFDFTDRTFIIGKTGAGKSTILDAIRWVLTGRCEGLDGAGRGRGVLMRQSAAHDESMVVTLHAQIGEFAYRLQRAYTKGGTAFEIEGAALMGTGSADEQYAAFLAVLGVSSDVLEAVLDSRVFLTAAHADAKNLLLAVLQPKVAVPGGDDKDAELITLGECDRRYTKAFEDRTGLNRAIKMLPGAIQPSEAVGDITALTAKVKAIETEREEKVKTRAGMVGQTGVLAAEAATLSTEGKGIDARLNALTAAWTDDEAKDAAGVRQAALIERDAVAAKVQHLTSELAILERAADSPSDLLDRINKHEPKKGCVLHPEIECKTSQTQFVQFVKKHKAAKAEATPDDPRHAELAKARTTLATLNAQIDRLANADVVTELLTRQGVILNRLAEIEGVTTEAADTTGIDGEIAALDERIKTGHERVAKKTRLASEWKMFDRDKAAREQAQADLSTAEAAVKLYGPKGARVQALEASLDKFHTTVNSHLSKFGFEIAVEVEPWRILVNGRARLSTSERLRVAIGVTAAFAEMTEVDLVLVDSIDWLLKEQRGQLTQTMGAYPQAQWIGCKAQEPGDAFEPKVGSVIRL